MTAPSDATRYPRGAGPFPNPIPKHGESNPKPITVTDGPYTPSITFLDQKPRSPPSNTSHRLNSGFSLLFEAFIMSMVKVMPVNNVAEKVNEHDLSLIHI